MKTTLLAAISAALAAFGVCALADDPPAGNQEDPMAPTATADVKKTLPPIDRDVPAKLETATFALG
jgi:hypothetical protein